MLFTATIINTERFFTTFHFASAAERSAFIAECSTRKIVALCVETTPMTVADAIAILDTPNF